MKFKVGDRVVSKEISGVIMNYCKAYPTGINPKSTATHYLCQLVKEPEDHTTLSRVEFEVDTAHEMVWIVEEDLRLDKQWYREQKINSLLV